MKRLRDCRPTQPSPLSERKNKSPGTLTPRWRCMGQFEIILRWGKDYREELTATEGKSLQAVMDVIGSAAEARGLTPEILDTLLRDE